MDTSLQISPYWDIKPEIPEVSICREEFNESFQITIKELRRRIRMMKNEKSTGHERIGPEPVKCAKEYLDRYLLELINSCLEQYSKEVERYLCVSLHKKESRKL